MTDIVDCLRAMDEDGVNHVGAAATTIEMLRADLKTALSMLADWCVAVDQNGTGWDDWDEYYKDAMYREGPLRSQLDAAIAEARSRW